jgi:glycosyltransferase involved in cell wall biosynthesis
MPVYNAEAFLLQAIESILAQTFADFEFLIIDDGSTDGSPDALRLVRDPRIRIVRQEHAGPGAAIATGIAMVRTPFVARMDADDVSLPMRLELEMDFLASHSQVGVVGAQIKYFTDDPARAGYGPSLETGHEEIFRGLIRRRHSICFPTTMFRTAAFREAGGIRIPGVGEDWDVLIRLGEVSRIANLPHVLHLYRLHPRNVSLVKMAEIVKRVEYALHTHEMRCRGLPEPVSEDFDRLYARRSGARRFREVLDAAAYLQYRAGLIDFLNGIPARGCTRAVVASLLSPRRAFVRAYRELKRVLGRGTRPVR